MFTRYEIIADRITDEKSALSLNLLLLQFQETFPSIEVSYRQFKGSLKKIEGVRIFGISEDFVNLKVRKHCSIKISYFYVV